MREDSRTLQATLAGAVIGGVIGYLFFSDRGRDLRRKFEPALDDIATELISFRHTLRKAADVAGEGWRLLNEAAADSQTGRYPNTHQSSPF